MIVKITEIKLDYPLTPAARPISSSAGGKKILAMLDKSSDRMLTLLRTMNDLSWAGGISKTDIGSASEPHWCNGWFPALDGLSLAAILKARNPATFFEIGSGYSTKFARKAISEHGLQTKIVSLDPQPRANIDALCDQIIRSKLEDADLAVFDSLKDGDVIFMDSSHRSFMNSDVSVFFLEILPRIERKIVYGLHDIFLPNDYANEWSERFYNEQYLLACYLIGGADNDNILFASRYAAENAPYREIISEFGKTIGLETLPDDGAGCFWMERNTR